MAYHITEKVWHEVGDEVNRALEQFMKYLDLGESLYQELTQLWVENGGAAANQAVADQLFQDTASAEQVNKVVDLKAAVTEIHNIFTTADLAAIRKMT